MVDQSDANLEEILTFVILDLEHQEDQEREQVDAQWLISNEEIKFEGSCGGNEKV